MRSLRHVLVVGEACSKSSFVPCRSVVFVGLSSCVHWAELVVGFEYHSVSGTKTVGNQLQLRLKTEKSFQENEP